MHISALYSGTRRHCCSVSRYIDICILSFFKLQNTLTAFFLLSPSSYLTNHTPPPIKQTNNVPAQRRARRLTPAHAPSPRRSSVAHSRAHARASKRAAPAVDAEPPPTPAHPVRARGLLAAARTAGRYGCSNHAGPSRGALPGNASGAREGAAPRAARCARVWRTAGRDADVIGSGLESSDLGVCTSMHHRSMPCIS